MSDGDVRVLSDTPLALIGEIIEQVTPGGFWVQPAVFGSIVSPQLPTPETIDEVCNDASFINTLETKHIRFVKRLRRTSRSASRPTGSRFCWLSPTHRFIATGRFKSTAPNRESPSFGLKS